jgi:hypothetical protein
MKVSVDSVADIRDSSIRVDMTHLYHVILKEKGVMKIMDNMLKAVCDDIQLRHE